MCYGGPERSNGLQLKKNTSELVSVTSAAVPSDTCVATNTAAFLK